MKYKEIPIKKYKFEKILQSEATYKVPHEPLYWFEYTIRKSIRVIPIWTSWNKENNKGDEEVYMLNITVIEGSFSQYKIEKFTINVSEIERILTIGKGDKYDILDWMEQIQPRNVRTKEQFQADYEHALTEINNGTE